MPTLRPEWLDLASFLGPLLLGVGLFLFGIFIPRLSWLMGVLLGLPALVFTAVVVASLLHLVPLETEAWISYLGGGTLILSLLALMLLGVAYGTSRRRFSSAFLLFMAGVALLLVGIEAGGRVWWRWFEPQAWQRFPDEDGTIVQTSALSCGPASATMFLYRHGVLASEGEIAYLAGTSMFGTDAFSLARAITKKVEDRGWRAEVLQTDYDALLKNPRPFIAYIHRPGGHAVFVPVITQQGVISYDPADGGIYPDPVERFKQEWDKVAVIMKGVGAE